MNPADAPQKLIETALYAEDARIYPRAVTGWFATWRWTLDEVVPQQAAFGSEPRRIYQDERLERWLHQRGILALTKWQMEDGTTFWGEIQDGQYTDYINAMLNK